MQEMPFQIDMPGILIVEFLFSLKVANCTEKALWRVWD